MLKNWPRLSRRIGASMHNRFSLFTPVIALLMALCAALVLVMAVAGSRYLPHSAAATFAVFIVVLILLRRAGRRASRMLEDIGQGIASAMGPDYNTFPMPVLTVYAGSEITWYNELCAAQVFDGRGMLGEGISDMLPGFDLNAAAAAGRADIEYGGKLYTAYLSQHNQGEELLTVLYLMEDTQLKYYATEYHLAKPSIAILAVDNYEELTQDYKDIERAQLMGDIERVVGEYISANYGFVVKISRDKFVAIIEERGFNSILAGKFEILDRVRVMHMSGRMSATMSIGIGREAASLYEADIMARQALEMCLGRGGDQAAIKTQNGYEFYGGVSKAIEKRTKVKTRIIAEALSELIASSWNVLVMGHRFADLDSLGAAVGILKSVKEMGKPAAIVLNREKNLVGPLLGKLAEGGYTDRDIVSPALAMELVDEGTLLVVVDTHVPHVLESEALYRACKNVAVIDHHRKLVDHIDNAVIFYHEPYASSASEMVAELVQYFPARPHITRVEAEAMMAGIMLDTKNFVMRTGVRTFEAAAYLRRMGADTVEVRKMFSSTMDAYQQKSTLVSTADVYRGCAIAVSDYQFDDIRVVAPQAADELLTISGVDASFIIYVIGDSVNISARSMGVFNVQVLMESLGGGGHQTMAAAQFSGDNPENIRKRLMEAIDEVCDTRDSRIQQMAERESKTVKN